MIVGRASRLYAFVTIMAKVNHNTVQQRYNYHAEADCLAQITCKVHVDQRMGRLEKRLDNRSVHTHRSPKGSAGTYSRPTGSVQGLHQWRAEGLQRPGANACIGAPPPPPARIGATPPPPPHPWGENRQAKKKKEEKKKKKKKRSSSRIRK